jgi:hypothetical protein
LTKGFSPATGDLDGYRRLGEIPQNNENALSGCPSRIGDQFCSAAFAQDKEEVNPFPFRAIAASPQLVQQLDAIKLKLDEAFNKLDAAAVAALYIANAVQVTPVGIFSGREAIEKFYTDVFNVIPLPIMLEKSVMSMPLAPIYAQSAGGLTLFTAPGQLGAIF